MKLNPFHSIRIPLGGASSVLVLVLMVVGCGGDSGFAPDERETPPYLPPGVASITVSPSISSLVSGSTLQLTVILKNAEGSVLSNHPITWSSNNTSCVTVDEDGLATAWGPPGADVEVSAVVDGVQVVGSVFIQVTGEHL